MTTYANNFISLKPNNDFMPDPVQYPKCGNNQITANKQGFSGGKAAAGAVLTGGIGC